MSVINILSRLLFYINFIIWLVPPFRQYKGGFFFYFLILALTDIFGILIFYSFGISSPYFYAPSSFALFLISLYYLQYIKPGLILSNILIFILGSALFLVFNNLRILISLMALFHFQTFCLFIIYFVRKLFVRNILYTYFLFLIFYEFTVIVKSLSYVLDIKTGLTIIHILNILEVLICLYFIIYNQKTNPRIYLKSGT